MVLVEFDKAYKSLWSPFAHLWMTRKVNGMLLLSYWKLMEEDFMMNINEIPFYVHATSMNRKKLYFSYLEISNLLDFTITSCILFPLRHKNEI